MDAEVPERVMSDAKSSRVEMLEREKELETRLKRLEEREKELDAEKAKKDKEKVAKEAKKRERRENPRKLNEEARENAERLKKQQKQLEEALQGSDASDTTVEEAAATSPESVKKKKKKGDKKKKKVKKVSTSESREEDTRKFTLQARTKVPTLEKGMTYAKYKTNVDMWRNAMKGYMSEKDMGMTLLQSLPNEDNRGGIKEQAWKKLGMDKLACKNGVTNLLHFLDKKLLKTDFVRCIELNDKHMAIKHHEGWSIDKYIAEAQQVWEQIADLGYSVPAPMKCASLIRGLNLTETQVHLIASKLSIGAIDLKEQTVEAIKTFADTNRVLTKAKNAGKTKEEESVNIAEDALGYRIGDKMDGVEEALLGGTYGTCNFCNKKGHFKNYCPDYKERLLKIRKYKEGKGVDISQEICRNEESPA